MTVRYTPIGVEPTKQLLRFGDILRWTGVSRRELLLIISAVPVILPCKIFRAGGRRMYRKADVERVFFKGFKGD
jgi:hypothetical protein